ncbi:hypothetical protein HMP0721_1567 [Pseudoramibacter alactolyticus ATCC 23263]|uniref:Uncharacterized protein n=1 Tax=Pseudoramibacter alactolyticus ATCC 23263 TaxID=887929 RepID=E6MHT2_9FIRM|nr:hypothetical protein HMP0721_1567 [Pseudoramibacter alactolyticus ATCC 23263]
MRKHNDLLAVRRPLNKHLRQDILQIRMPLASKPYRRRAAQF